MYMRTFIKATLLFAMLLATGSLVHAQISVGIVIAAPPPPRAVVVMTERPDPDSVWVGGYWYPVENHYKWHEGYWTRPPYEGAHWVAPRHDGERYHAGYWEGDRGRVEHNHHWDKEDGRDHHDHGKHGGQDHGHDK